MRYFCVFIILFCITSCQYFDKKKIDAEDLLNEELKAFNWNEVDQYPSFAVCDSSSTKAQRKSCFEKTLTSHINSKLSEDVIIVSEMVQDTVIMAFGISEKGEISVKQIISNAFTKTQIPNIDSLLTHCVSDLPVIFPAIKRGQQVSTEFKLPIIIEVH